MKGRVLIVDDDDIHRTMLAEILKPEGYQLFEARNGTEGVERARKDKPDLILLDITMPDLDGYEVCREIRRYKGLENIPVIFVSARSDMDSKLEGLNLGAVDYLTKPFDNQEIRARIKSHITIQNLARSLRTANHQLVLRQRKLDEDLSAAAHIQRSLLPPRELQIPSVNFAWRFLPSETVGGDIFNVLHLDQDHFAFYMIDVSGHGVPSAMMAVSVTQLLSSQTSGICKRRTPRSPYYELIPPADVLGRLNHEFPFEQFGKYFTICYLLLNRKTGVVSFSNAGHPHPIVIRSNQGLQFLKEGGTVIGMGDNVSFEQGKIQLQAGDRIFVYTDGIMDYVNVKTGGKGTEQFHEQIKNARQEKDLEKVCDHIFESIKTQGKGVNYRDDMSLMVIEFQGD